MLKNLKLERPIAFFDVETTGLNQVTGRIVEISILKINPDGTEDYKNRRVNPGIPIPTRATDIHGITDADIANEPVFASYAKGLCAFLDGCDLAGFNIDFDLKFLEAEFARAKVSFSREGRFFVDCKTIYHKKEPRTLEAAYKRYCGKELVNAHSSEADTRASIEILEGQLEVYEDLPRDVAGLCAICRGKDENLVDDTEPGMVSCIQRGKRRPVQPEPYLVLGFGKDK